MPAAAALGSERTHVEMDSRPCQCEPGQHRGAGKDEEERIDPPSAAVLNAHQAITGLGPILRRRGSMRMLLRRGGWEGFSW